VALWITGIPSSSPSPRPMFQVNKPRGVPLGPGMKPGDPSTGLTCLWEPRTVGMAYKRVCEKERAHYFPSLLLLLPLLLLSTYFRLLNLWPDPVCRTCIATYPVSRTPYLEPYHRGEREEKTKEHKASAFAYASPAQQYVSVDGPLSSQCNG